MLAWGSCDEIINTRIFSCSPSGEISVSSFHWRIRSHHWLVYTRPLSLSFAHMDSLRLPWSLTENVLFSFLYTEDCYRHTVIVDGEEVIIDVLDTACRVSKRLIFARVVLSTSRTNCYKFVFIVAEFIIETQREFSGHRRRLHRDIFHY